MIPILAWKVHCHCINNLNCSPHTPHIIIIYKGMFRQITCLTENQDRVSSAVTRLYFTLSQHIKMVNWVPQHEGRSAITMHSTKHLALLTTDNYMSERWKKWQAEIRPANNTLGISLNTAAIPPHKIQLTEYLQRLRKLSTFLFLLIAGWLRSAVKASMLS